jgi:predicted TIM-barrel fold metal-dependent hydrolase
MKGLKLYPPTGFYPDAPCCSPLYEVCLDRGLPVVYHGTTSPLSDTPYCHPDGFRRLAERYPALKIVIAHAGGRDWFTAAAQACLDYEHIYLDISGFQSLLDPDLFKAAMETVYSTLMSFEKVLFGTDSPIFNRMCSIRDMVANLKALNIPEQEKANLFGNTGRKILGMA